MAQDEPCAIVATMSADWVSEFPSATQVLIPATAAANCLKSVPYNKEEDLKLIDELTYYINWQSNLAYLSDPPEGYNEERVDVLEEIKSIKSKVEKEEYDDEYTIMFDLSMALQKTYDFHFGFSADILNVFSFRRGNIGRGLKDEFALASVSTDGKALPKLYNYYDIMFNQSEGWLASPISEINNVPAVKYAQDFSQTFPYLEDHARYNKLFISQADLIQQGGIVNLFGRGDIPTDGNHTVVKHENGTEVTYINVATVPLDSFDGISDGQSFFDTFCNQGPPSTSTKRDVHRLSSNKVEKRQTFVEQIGLPTPELMHSEGVIGGYYLTGKGYEDVAVMIVPSFSPASDEGTEEFQDLTGKFLVAAVKAGKKKLVIDLRGNGGGRVFLGYDLFKQLFPDQDPYGATRFRANDAFNVIGKAWNDYIDEAKITYEQAVADFAVNGFKSPLVNAWRSIFNYRLPLDEDNNNFTSWEQYFGPHEHNNDKFTTPARYDLNNFFSDDLNMDITGYRTRAKLLTTTQPFKAEDIVLLQDGGCGSTCAVFSEFMKTQGNVQQVVIGGLPETGPMQGVAGSKGAQVFTFTRVYSEAANVYEELKTTMDNINSTELGKLVAAERPLMRSAYQEGGETMSVINLRDNMRLNDDSGTPLEFIYEAADCRLFYTAGLVQDPVAVWKKTVDAHWGDAKAVCVEGSTGHKSSISGGATPGDSNGDGQDEKNDKKKESTANSFKVGGAITGMVALAAAFMVML
ncbi:hypothetical protein P154DRAFT_429470 [Amniculicola lignicola CBS 123094]|uniref:Uncharacterized protein n=1 Tax=Amniculicola lignicola CBS 123094 TaxID=1392246 RepID=A0A6A5WMC8_9PLEO|nr:hypothetical protein P154DRAFT_429470 [Amniculicola lignicola CBS 123094]